MSTIYKRFEHLVPDAPAAVAKFLEKELVGTSLWVVTGGGVGGWIGVGRLGGLEAVVEGGGGWGGGGGGWGVRVERGSKNYLVEGINIAYLPRICLVSCPTWFCTDI